jgi:hypothetical protein
LFVRYSTIHELLIPSGARLSNLHIYMCPDRGCIYVSTIDTLINSSRKIEF